MKIIKSHGCYHISLTVDNKYVDSYTPDEQKDLIDKLINVIKTDNDDNMSVIHSLLDVIGADDVIYEDGSCETCGHSMYDEIWDIGVN